MLDLIERLEKAESGSRLLDAMVAVAVRGGSDPQADGSYKRIGADFWRENSRKVTTLIDSAMALVAEQLPGHDWSLGHLPESDDADHEEHHEFGCLLYEAPHVASPRDGLGHGATAPLAACVALLRAIQTKEAGHGG